jgi:predicted dehydrogenase
VKRWLDEGHVGRVVSAQLSNGEYMPAWHSYEDYRQTYGARRDLGGGAIGTQSHELDCALWLFGPPRTVYALGGHLSNLEIDVEDVASLTLDCGTDDRPLPVSVHLNYLQQPAVKHCTIVGDRGTIRCDILACTAEVMGVNPAESATFASAQFQRNDMFLAFLQAFLAAVAGGGEPVVRLDEAMATMRTIDAARTSMAKGCVVVL